MRHPSVSVVTCFFTANFGQHQSHADSVVVPAGLRLRDLPAAVGRRRTPTARCWPATSRPTAEGVGGTAAAAIPLRRLAGTRDALDGRLMVTRGQPDKRIPALAKAVGATPSCVGRFTPFGRRRDDAVREALGDIPLEASGSPYLVSPGRVIKGDGDPVQGVHPVLRRMAEARLAGACGVGPEIGAVDRPCRRQGRCRDPRPGVELELPAGEQAALRQWKKFVDDDLADYADDRNRPDLPGTSRMSAHLKFGTIHPRTMAADLAEARVRRRTCGSWPFATSTPRCWTNGPTARGGTGTSPSTRCRSTRAPTPRGVRGVEGGTDRFPDRRRRACVSSPRRVGCTTGCG